DSSLRVVAVPWPEGVEGSLRRGLAELDSAHGKLARDDDLEDDLHHVRARLTPEEDERLSWLGARAARAATDAFLAARPGDLEAARAVESAFNDATVPERTLGEVLSIGVAAYAKAGYPDEWRLHHQGGTIAYRGREILATPNEPERVERGMAFAWNPSVTGAKV